MSHDPIPDDVAGEDEISPEWELELAQLDLPIEKEGKVRELILQMASFSGPLPQPDDFERYNSILPGSADRLLSVYEENSKHNREIVKAELDNRLEIGKVFAIAHAADLTADRTERRFGQFFGFLIGVTGIICGCFLAMFDHPIIGTVFGGGTVVALVSVFVYGRKVETKDSDDDATE